MEFTARRLMTNLCFLVTFYAVACYAGHITLDKARSLPENVAPSWNKDAVTLELKDKVEGSADDRSFPEAKLIGDLEDAEDGNLETSDDVEDFHAVPMPTDFQSYDILVSDGFISLEELINVTGAVENVREAFRASDIDGDGLLTQAEFDTAPWMLSGDPPSQGFPDDKESEIPEIAAQRMRVQGDVISDIREDGANDVMQNT